MASSLYSLPLDVIFVIASFSDWRDILSLGQTSHRYRDVATGLSVWVNAVQDLTWRYRISLKTFEYENMELRELQQLVARPTMLRDICRSSAQLQRRASREYEVEGKAAIISTALVPGGRWIVTGHYDGELNVWDLNSMKDRSADERWGLECVHSTRMEGCRGSIGVLLIQRSSDCGGVVVLTESSEPTDPPTFDLAVTEFPLGAAVQTHEPSPSHITSKTWSGFSGNDTIALEGDYVAAEYRHLTRVWDWKRGLFTAYRWSISIDSGSRVEDVLERVGLVDISLRPPYVYLLHTGYRIFAVFKIPEMSTTDPYLIGQLHSIRPTMVVSLDPQDVLAVQFINPWTLQHDTPLSSTLPFFLLTSHPETSLPLLLRYDVLSEEVEGLDTIVHRPMLKQRISLPSRAFSFDIVSPTVVVDDLSTFWGSEIGLLYVPDVSNEPITHFRGIVGGGEKRLEVTAKIVLYDESPYFSRHRVGMDAMSGKTIKATRNTIIVTEFKDRPSIG